MTSLFTVQPSDQKTLFLPEEDLDLVEREENIGRRLDVERQRLQTEKGEKPLTPKELSGTRNVITYGPGPDQLRPGERIDQVNKFFRTFDSNRSTKWPSILPAISESESHRIFSRNPKVRSDQQRVFSSTGFLPDGTFASSEILRQTKKLDKYSQWPAGKSLEGFINEVNRSWNDAGYDTKLMKTETGGLRIDKGHVIAATAKSGIFSEGGANFPTNLVPQPGLASANLGIDDSPYDRFRTAQIIDELGDVEYQSANVPQKNTILKDPADLKVWNLGGNLSESFNEYLISDDPGIIDYTKVFTPRQRGSMAHQLGASPDELGYRFEAQNQYDTSMKWNAFQSYKAPKLSKDNPTIPSEVDLAKVDKIKSPQSRARGLMNLVKNTFKGDNAARGVFRGLARAAGMSNNPLVNIAGDVVGAAIDGAVFVADPSVDNAADLILSGGQVLTTAAGVVVAAIPIPGARVGAFAIMKLGDNIDKAGKTLATIERLWGMSREGRGLASGKLKPDGGGADNILKVKKKVK